MVFTGTEWSETGIVNFPVNFGRDTSSKFRELAWAEL